MRRKWSRVELHSVLTFLRQMDEKCVFAEVAYPSHRLHFVTHEFVQLDWRTSHDDEGSDFWQLFKYDSFFEPISSLTLLSKRASEGGTVWCHLSPRSEQSTWKPLINIQEFGFLVPIDDTFNVAAVRELFEQNRRRVFVVEDVRAKPLNYMLVLPEEVSARYLKGQSRSGRRRHSAAVFQVPRLKFEGSMHHAIHALASDCPWGAEGGQEGSWRWTGPNIIDRMCLGDLPRDVCKIEVEFLQSERHVDLSHNVCFQVNGREVAFRNQAGMRNGGTVTIDVPVDVQTPVVLGVAAYPDGKQEGDRLIRACLAGLRSSN